MEIFDGKFADISRPQIAPLVNELILKHGGVQGIIALLMRNGLRETAKSWVESGQNLPISADQIQQIFGAETIKDFAARVDLDPQQVAQKLSLLLPETVDVLTPRGVIPKL